VLEIELRIKEERLCDTSRTCFDKGGRGNLSGRVNIKWHLIHVMMLFSLFARLNSTKLLRKTPACTLLPRRSKQCSMRSRAPSAWLASRTKTALCCTSQPSTVETSKRRCSLFRYVYVLISFLSRKPPFIAKKRESGRATKKSRQGYPVHRPTADVSSWYAKYI